MSRQIIKFFSIIVLFSMLIVTLPLIKPITAQAEATAAQYVTIARTTGSPEGFTSLNLYANSLGENGTVAFQADRGAGNELWLWENNNLNRIFEGIVTPDNFSNNLFVGQDGRVAISIHGPVNEEVHVRLPDGTVVRAPLNTDSSYTHNLNIHTSGGKWLVSQRSYDIFINGHQYVYDNFWLTDGVGTSAPFELEVYDVNYGNQNVSDYIFRNVRGITDDGAFLIYEITSYNHENVGERLYFTGTRNEVLFEFSRPNSGEDTGDFLGRVLLNGVDDVLFEKISRVNGIPVKWSLMLSQNGGLPVEMATVDPRTGQRFDRLLGLSAAREVLMLVQYGDSDYRWMDSFDLNADPFSVPFESLFGQTGTVQLMVNMNDSGQKALLGKLADNTLVLLVELPQIRWTILHYMAGDNDLASSYWPIFNHLENMAGLNDLRILVLWDNKFANDSAYYEVMLDNHPTNMGGYTLNVNKFSKGELNMGDPKTLSDFITWGVKYSPSDHYALILDDHGSGLGGLAWDETSNDDFITLAELRTALSNAYSQTNQKMDILYMAMCLMGMLEDAYQVRGFADYYIASQDLQTAYVPYLSGFNPQDDPATAALKLAEAYSNEMITKNKEYTISVADLSQLDNLVTATNQFGAVLAENMVTIADNITAVATVVQRFDEDGDSIISISDEYMDLYEFAFLIGIVLPDELPIIEKAEAVKFAINNYIIYEKHASGGGKILNDSHGVSIFFPATSSSYYNGDNYDFALGADWVLPNAGASLSTTMAESTPGWGSFLSDYFQFTQPGGPDNPTPPLPIAKVQLEPTIFSIFLPLTSK